MKKWIIAGAVLILGFAAGWVSAQAFWIRTFRAAIPSHIHALEDKQEYSCMLSLSVLTRLEAGDTDYAKRILAREVATYYHHPWQADAPGRQKVLTLIEATKPKSAVLSEQLRKTSQ